MSTNHTKPADGDSEDLKEEYVIVGGTPAQVAQQILDELPGWVPDIFRQNERVCVVRRGKDGEIVAKPLGPSALVTQLNKYMPLMTWKENDKGERYLVEYAVGTGIAMMILENPEATHIPELEAVNQLPCIITGEGKLSARRGYDPVSRYYFAGRPGVKIPTDPTPDDVKRAKSLIFRKVLVNMPWEDPRVDRANFFSMLMVNVLRHYIGIDAHVPALILTANHPGSGKTMLARLLATPDAETGGMTYTTRADELQKKITAQFVSARSVVLVDNMPKGSEVKGSDWERLFTSTHWADRRLGTNDQRLEFRNDKLWVFTGNNISAGGEMPRRVVLVRLKTGPNPESRPNDDWAIKDLDEWLNDEKNRLSVYRALVILALDWIQNGEGRTINTRKANFSRWASAMAGLLDHHRVRGFLGNEAALSQENSEDREWQAFLEYWYDEYKDEPVTTRTLTDDSGFAGGSQISTDADPVWTDMRFGEVLHSAQPARELGKELTKMKNHSFGPYTLHKEDKQRGGRKQYWFVTKEDD